MNLSHKRLADYSCNSHTDSIIHSIHEFNFDGLAGITFEFWFKKHEYLFKVDLQKLGDAVKIRTLLRILGMVENECQSNRIVPKNP